MLESMNLNKHGIVVNEEAIQTSMPIVIKTRNSNNIYGTVKNERLVLPTQYFHDLWYRVSNNVDDKSSKYSSLNKHKETLGYNAHPHYLKGNLNRNILKAKMEIRTGSDCNENEYNLILKNDKNSLMHQLNTNIVFSPSEDSSVNTFVPSVEKACKKSSSLQSKAKNRNPGVMCSQEHVSKKFISRNDPYQNALSDKIIVRTSSEKRVSNNSKHIYHPNCFVEQR